MTAFATIFGVLAWVYEQLLSTQISVNLVPIDIKLPAPPTLSISLPVIQTSHLLTLPTVIAVIMLTATLIFAALWKMASWRSGLADLFAVLLPPTYSLSSGFLLGRTLLSEQSDAINTVCLFVAGVCSAVVSFGAWVKFGTVERLEFVSGKKLNWFEKFYHFFWIKYFGLCAAIGWVIACVLIATYLEPAMANA